MFLFFQFSKEFFGSCWWGVGDKKAL